MARTFPRTPRPPSPQARHAEWLSLLDISGPFLSLSVLTDAFPQGIDTGSDESGLAHRLRRAYTEEWLPNRARSRPVAALHTAWIDFVLAEVLEWPTDLVASGQLLPPGLEASLPESGETLRPSRALLDPPDRGGKPRMLVSHHEPNQDLDAPLRDDRSGAKASPATQMRDLLQATGVRLGLVTNGEEWLLVSAAAGEITGFVTWHAYLWLEERPTLQAFRALLGVERFFGVPDDETLEGLLTRSAGDQAEVTTQLGDQVRQAIELLVAAIDRADRDRNGALLAGIPEAGVYEAAVTTMMRLVFLLFAEDQRPPLFGNNPLYDAHYAVSTLINDLQEAADRAGEEVLERKEDAWSRLLSVFRLVHGGSDHDAMRLPAYGGSLFDPNRFPFLEGRAPGSDWERDAATPLPISNRVVLHVLEAIQFLQMRAGRGGGTERRRLSFRALDVEQIGHVYERLLEHTVRRALGPVLGLVGAVKNGARQEPEIPLADLEAWLARGEDTLIEALAKPSGRTAAQLKAALHKPLALGDDARFLVACDNEPALWARVRPFAALVRSDRAGRPWVIRDGGLYVTSGTDRRQSGAHYTPRSLTEPIVQHALDPLVFVGPAEGAPRAEWKLRPASALLALKICDPAMGSGAFLVQTCRYLAERLVEAWDATERAERVRIRVAPNGGVSRGDATEDLLPLDPKERQLRAMQLVTDHCLYGVDKNPLAVEMAKLSLWLTTLQKDRPFTYLDHALRIGDSLLGIARLDQLIRWSLGPDSTEPIKAIFAQTTGKAVDRATALRIRIETKTVVDARDVEEQASLLADAEEATTLARLGADLLVAAELAPNPARRETLRQELLYKYQLALMAAEDTSGLTSEGRETVRQVLSELRAEADRLLGGHTPFHWPLEFPEVFVLQGGEGTAGFSAVVGNPPFMGGQKITGAISVPYRDYLVNEIAGGTRGSADLSTYFLLRATGLLRQSGQAGLLTTNTIAQGDSRQVGLDRLAAAGYTITRAVPSRKWPGLATLEVAHLWVRRGEWHGGHVLDEQSVASITPYLTAPGRTDGNPFPLAVNAGKSFIGSYVLGMGFVLESKEVHKLIAADPRNKDVLFPYLNGEDLNSRPDQSPSRWVINFHDWPLDRAQTYPEPFRIVLEKVKPERERNNRPIYRDRWWQHAEKRPALYRAMAGMDRVLVIPRVSKYLLTVWRPTDEVPSEATVVIALDAPEWLALLQSTIHETWARAMSSTLETRMRYGPSDCFDTLPQLASPRALRTIGATYDEHRRGLTFEINAGLTELYNRYHDPSESATNIVRLRELHAEMDHAVAAAYGWDDLDLGHGFLETKQGLRYSISEPARCEVLDRLLELNHKHHAEEVAQELHIKGKGAKKRAASGGTPPKQQSLTIERGG